MIHDSTDRTSQGFPHVFIVGAGPGAPDLITVRGQMLLSQADVVFYTGSLIPEQMLTHCRRDAEIIDTRSLVLETWRSRLVNRAKAGDTVVRLQDGDPCLYGALHELVMHLFEEKVDFEIVPGVSAFQAAAARLQSELTIPDLVQSIILTRIQGNTNVPSRENLAALAAHQASLCLYLSARHCAKAQAQLMEYYPADTPMALCYRLGWPDEQVVVGQLSQMAQLTRETNLTRTVLYVISPALAGAADARSRLYSSDHAHIFRLTDKVE